MKTRAKKELFLNSYRLDHAGIIYPYIAKSTWNQVFRLEAELDENIDIQSIVAALNNIKPRFPSFFVTIKKLKTLYLLKRTNELPRIIPEKTLCKFFDLDETEYPLFRITYSGTRLGLELFHSVADGNGAMVFFINLIAEYYIIRGFNIYKESPVFKHGLQNENKDTENSFYKVYKNGGKSASRSEEPAFQFNKQVSDCPLRLVSFMMPVDEFKKKAKELNASVTELLAAIYTKALCISAKGENSINNIKLQIPLDLRRRFNSTTLRNFSLYFNTSVPSEYAYKDIKDIVELIKPQFEQGADKVKLQNDVFTNVSQSEMKIFKIMPNFIKKGILKIGNSMYGERLFTSPLSNIGIINLPEDLESHVNKFGFCIGKTLKNTVYSAVVTYKGMINWSLSTVVEKRNLQNNIVEILDELNIPCEITER